MAAYSDTSENDLIHFLKEGDHSAFTEIYNRYFHVLYVQAYKKLRNETEAKDIIQELFTNLWVKRDSNQINSNLAGYLFRSVRNKIFDLYAHEKVKSDYVISLKNYIKKASFEGTDDLIRSREMTLYINQQISSLPPKMRVVFELSRKDHLSHKEIAEKLDISENNVSKQVNNAIRILRMKLGAVIFILLLMNL